MALLVATGLPACQRHGAHAHVLAIADNVDPASLNPLLAHDQDTIGYDLLVTQTLVGLSAENRLVPVLVTRVPSRANGDVSRDGKTIVYHLRHDVCFADGTGLTAADVAFTYRAIVDPRNPVESIDAYRRIAALRTPDRYTIVVRLHDPWNAAVAELFAQADFAFGILPAHAFSSTDVRRGAWDQRPFGTGPFRVTQWQRANHIVLERNPYYRACAAAAPHRAFAHPDDAELAAGVEYRRGQPYRDRAGAGAAGAADSARARSSSRRSTAPTS